MRSPLLRVPQNRVQYYLQRGLVTLAYQEVLDVVKPLVLGFDSLWQEDVTHDVAFQVVFRSSTTSIQTLVSIAYKQLAQDHLDIIQQLTIIGSLNVPIAYKLPRSRAYFLITSGKYSWIPFEVPDIVIRDYLLRQIATYLRVFPAKYLIRAYKSLLKAKDKSVRDLTRTVLNQTRALIED